MTTTPDEKDKMRERIRALQKAYKPHKGELTADDMERIEEAGQRAGIDAALANMNK